jgi:hypothetical protein
LAKNPKVHFLVKSKKKFQKIFGKNRKVGKRGENQKKFQRNFWEIRKKCVFLLKMSKIYKKEFANVQIFDFIKCDKCGLETPFSLVIDDWCVIDNENYCRKCQKEYRVGWYNEKLNRISNHRVLKPKIFRPSFIESETKFFIKSD